MNRKKMTALITCLACTAFCLAAVSLPAAPAVAPEPETPSPAVVLRLSERPLGDALAELCTKAGWGLVVKAPAAELAAPMTVILPKKTPADEVLALLMADRPLDAVLRNGILIVSAKAAVPPASTGAPDRTVEPTGNGAPDQTAQTDSETVDVDGFSDLKDLRRRFKDKWRDRRISHRSDDGVERVEIGEPVFIREDETVTSAVSVGDTTTVAGTVSQDAVSVGGDLIVRSGARVGKDAVAVGGDVVVEDGAAVDGEAVAVGGKVVVKDGAAVKGNRTSVNLPLPAVGGLAGVLSMAGVFWVIAAIARSVIIFTIALLIAWLAPERVAVAREYLHRRPGWSVLSGVLVVLAVIPLLAVLAITIIGIPLIPIVAVLLAAVLLFGMTALLVWLGEVIPLFRSRKSAIAALCLGFVAFLLLNMIPVLGGIIMAVAAFAAVGATFLSRFGNRPSA